MTFANFQRAVSSFGSSIVCLVAGMLRKISLPFELFKNTLLRVCDNFRRPQQKSIDLDF